MTSSRYYEEPIELDHDELAKANFDLAERIYAGGVTVSYEEDGDTLLITIGAPCPALTEHLIDDIYFRVEPESMKVVGIVVLSFVSNFLSNNKLARKLLSDWFEELRHRGGKEVLEGAAANKLSPVFQAALCR